MMALKVLLLYNQVPIGVPVYNSHAYILDSEFKPVRNPGEVGQLFVSSPNLALGYCGGNTQAKGYVTSEVRSNNRTPWKVT